jgi:anti-anti-sigma factor
MDYIQEEHGSTIVEVVNLGRATLNEAGEFKKILFQDIETGWKQIIIDLTECEFIDSTFLGTMVISLKKMIALGGKIRLVGIQPEVEKMFQLTKMNRLFEVLETRENALESFI